MLTGLVVMGAGVSLSMPAMADAIMRAIPPEKAGVGAASLPAALAEADGRAERAGISAAFASGLQTSQLGSSVAVLAGGLLAALLLRRAERAAMTAGAA
jgi:hypothetical protein